MNVSPMRALRPTMIAAALLVGLGSAQAVTVLTNLPGTSAGTGTLVSDSRLKGVGMSLGATPMTFDSMQVLIDNLTPANILSGGIYSNVGGNPGALLSAFVPVAVDANFPATVVTLNTAASFTLNAGASYWFVLDSPNPAAQMRWQSLSPNAAPTASGDVGYLGYRFSTDTGTTWISSSVFNGVAINASVVPEPAAAWLLVGGIGLLAWRMRR